jgi:hypothetical protein
MDLTRMNTPPRLAALCFVIASAVSLPAAAQDDKRAEALFNQGLADMEAGRYEQGCPALGQGFELDPRAGTLFTLAECEARRGRIATALARNDEYLALFARMTAAQQNSHRDQEKLARARRAELGPQVPELTVLLPPNAPAGTQIRRDGAELAASALGVGLPVDPGEHVLSTQAPGAPPTEIRITLRRGEKKQLTLEVKRPPSAPAATPPPGTAPPAATPALPSPEQPPPSPIAPAPASQGPGGQRVAAYVVGAVGLAGLVAGGVTGGLAIGKHATIKANCVDRDATTAVCNATGLAAASSSKPLELVSTIGFGVGIAGVGAAVVLLLTAPARPKSAPAQGASRGWIDAGVLSAGQTGAVLGVRGGW